MAFAALGFSYPDALAALHQRYLDGVGGRRPAGYWSWGSLAALLFSAGPLAGAGLAQVRTLRVDGGPRSRPPPPPRCSWPTPRR